ncbi:uncharacterized protein LOC143228001 [Tachypleus tridentatus]|uniref:uncharacterized protein LOC143228001 n=1 Tax=Tachypleus tridentatus TaxID=6853 RepID=UPI003FD146F1
MEDFNFRSLTSEKCVKLQDFPLTLHHLSIRNSIIDRSVFFYTNIGKPVTFDLEILDLGRCVYLADGNIHQWPNLPQLKELFLEGCPFIDKHLLESIMGLQRTLKVLDIEGSYGFETAVFIIGENTVNLEELYVGCTLTKDCSLFLITKGMFKHLKKLCLSGTRVTDTGLEHLTSIVLSLTWLKLDMTHVSNRCISNVRRLLPEVVVIKNTNVTVFRVFRNEGCAHYLNKAHHLL